MTSTLAQGVGRSPGEPVRPLGLLALSPALLVLLLGSLALRLTIAYVLFPASGFESDLASYASWAGSMAEYGPGGFYEHAGFADYPPAYLYVLWAIGLLAGPGGDTGELIKLPPMLLDLAVGFVIYRLVRGWTWPGARSGTLALAAAALYLFNPVSFYDSALWGQTDAAGALVLLLGLAALIRGNSEGAAALAATAALVKPQFGVVLIPLVAFVLIKRHLVRPGSGPRHRPWAPQPLAGWLARQQGPLRLLTSFAFAWLLFFIVALPFGMGPLEYLERMFGTAGGYGYLTVNAYNVWALLGADGQPSLAEALTWSEDSGPLLGPLPGVAIGAALLVGGFLWGTVRGAVRDDRWTLDRGRHLPGHRLLHPAHARARALHLPGHRPDAAAGGRAATLGHRAAAAEHRCLHQPARHPDPAAVRHRERGDPGPGRVVPYAAADHALGAAADRRGAVGGVAAAAQLAHQPRRLRSPGRAPAGHGRRVPSQARQPAATRPRPARTGRG